MTDLAESHRAALDLCLATCRLHPDGLTGETSTAHLAWMCETARDGIDSLPVDKVARWLGYVEGCLTFKQPALMGPYAPAPVPSGPDGNRLLAAAHRELFERYQPLCRVGSAAGHAPLLRVLDGACALSLRHGDRLAPAYLSRWLGFVQGVLTCLGRLSVKEERDFSRPLFHAAYAAAGAIPPTLQP